MKVSAPGAARIWQPLRERGFRRLWTGQTLSDLANWLDFVAISTLIVYAWGHGPAEMALYSACVGLPWVVIGPWASVRVRRFRGKTILILCDVLRAVIVFAMVWADSLPVLLALVFLKMSVSSVFDPVRQQAVKGLVGAERLAQATSLSGISANLTKIVGPMLGGISALWLGQAAPFVIGASLYALSAAMLAGLPRWGTEARRAERGRGGALRQAIAHMKGRPLLRAGMVYMGLTYALIFVYDNLFAVLAKDAGLREEGFALLIGCVGAGSVAGAIAA
ncbi:MFS transporter, partial [Paenibacillus agaridevorans]|uniref:MFS transporter n=1 Tax=Paenibacillus agaridevorans TaxID=171404 RepID=UPI000D599183